MSYILGDDIQSEEGSFLVQSDEGSFLVDDHAETPPSPTSSKRANFFFIGPKGFQTNGKLIFRFL